MAKKKWRNGNESEETVEAKAWHEMAVKAAKKSRQRNRKAAAYRETKKALSEEMKCGRK